MLTAVAANPSPVTETGLQECLEASQSTKGVCRVEFCTGGSHVERIGFILTHFLNGFAVVIRCDEQSRFRRIGRRMSEYDSRLMVEGREESLSGAVQARVMEAGESVSECAIDFERAAARLELRGQRHDVKFN